MLGQVFENLISYPLLPGSYPVVDFDSVAASRIQAVSQFYELSVFISVGPVPGAWTRPSKHFLSDLWVDWVGEWKSVCFFNSFCGLNGLVNGKVFVFE